VAENPADFRTAHTPIMDIGGCDLAIERLRILGRKAVAIAMGSSLNQQIKAIRAADKDIVEFAPVSRAVVPAFRGGC